MTLSKRNIKHLDLYISNRGHQYCSRLYTDCLEENGININMTENGDSFENVIAERVNGILKDELVYLIDLKYNTS